MKKLLYIVLNIVIGYFVLACDAEHQGSDNADSLYDGFINPGAEYRPFVRWWWNGNSVTKDEIKRQLDVLSAAGIGGIEINPIAIPSEVSKSSIKPIQWLSEDWNHLVGYTAKEAKKRGMITDLLVGSGWPFGGEFLEEDELIKRVVIHSLPYTGGDIINESKQGLIEKAMQSERQWRDEQAVKNELMFLSLLPVPLKGVDEILDLTDSLTHGERIRFAVPSGDYRLVYGVLQHGHRSVMHGAPGAAGPVMDHFKRDVTLNYLNRLLKISEDIGVPLDELFRALFCDSIELAGANWSSGFAELFYEQHGYRIEPYFPFIFYEPSVGYDDFHDAESKKFDEEIARVRYDYNKFLVSQFLENFTRPFQSFCDEHSLKCRYQAYGNPFLMGIMEGNMVPDIPEGNNWISSTTRPNEWKWNQQHGFMIWNLYAASGGRLAGRREISCESMTSTKDIFKTSLEEIKRYDDMNFITGINQTILHGYNYSPKDAGFPGWIQYGAYFSEHNSWWPYFPKWVDYNARLSYIFRSSDPKKKIAVLGPTADVWSDKGLYRTAFHTTPWYCYRLWESLSQAGSSSDYISEKIIQDGQYKDGKLIYGPMAYEAIILCDFKSIQPATAIALENYVASGGKVIFVGDFPSRSTSKVNVKSDDDRIGRSLLKIETDFPTRLHKVNPPVSEENLLDWTQELLGRLQIAGDVLFDEPNKNLYQIRMEHGDKDIYFFVNSHRTEPINLKATFPMADKIPWAWNAEDGSRVCLQVGNQSNELEITMRPLQSLLLVFEPSLKDEPNRVQPKPAEKKVQEIVGTWELSFEHVTGERFEKSFNSLVDLSDVESNKISEFAGVINYVISFESDGRGKWIQLTEVNRGISEVYLNDHYVGTNWYGQPLFLLEDDVLKPGLNKLHIKYTPVLHNYVLSLKSNPTARKWTAGNQPIAMGLEGFVEILN